MKKMLKKLIKNVQGIEVLENRNASEYSFMRTGGILRTVVKPSDTGSLFKTLKYLKDNNIDYHVIGKGSNILFSDKAINTVTVITSQVNRTCIENEAAYADCGAGISKLALECANQGLSGLEFACGIPGSVGGAIAMNAGAFGCCIGNLVLTVYTDKEPHGLTSQECMFSYRKSRFISNNETILAAEFILQKKDGHEIAKTVAELSEMRIKKQPGGKSLGSVFKNPEGGSAGRLIEECGLKGFGIGGAQVSQKHANFIINTGGATSGDVNKLIDYIKSTVYLKKNIYLEEEIQKIGEF